MFKRIISLNKNKNARVLGEVSDENTGSTSTISDQKRLDKKLIYSLNNKRIPNLKQLKHLPKILKPKEKVTFSGLISLVIVSFIFLVVTFYLNNFLPTPTIGGDYTEGLIGAPRYINPILSQTNDVDSDISRLIFSGLMKYDSDLQLAPELAASWEESEDQKTYTFNLKQGVKWHDGEDLTADDVVFTFQSIQDPDFKSPLLISFRGVTIEKIDDLTVKFTLPEIYPAFLEVLTFGILPEHIWGTIPPINANLTEYNLKPVGSGVWKFKSLAKDRLGNIKSYTLEPNQDFYGPKPYIEKLTFNFYPDFQTAVIALKNNSVDGISFLPKEFKSQLISEKNLNFNSFYLPQYTAVFFNQKQNEALKEKSVRQALAVSINKSKILTEALGLEGEIIDGPILPVLIEQNEDVKINFDINKANELLDNAKWSQITPDQYQAYLAKKEAENLNQATTTSETETTATQATTTEAIQAEDIKPEPSQAFYRQKDDTILEITLTTVNQPENVKAAELIKGFWEAIGVKVNLDISEASKIRREVIKTRNYEALLFGIIVNSNPDPYPFWHSSQIQDPGLNLAMFANREVDKLLEDAKKTVSPEEQLQKYQRFQEILVAELPAIFLHTPTYTYVIDKKIKGINIDRVITPADRFNNIQDWYIKTKRLYQGDVH